MVYNLGTTQGVRHGSGLPFVVRGGLHRSWASLIRVSLRFLRTVGYRVQPKGSSSGSVFLHSRSSSNPFTRILHGRPLTPSCTLPFLRLCPISFPVKCRQAFYQVRVGQRPGGDSPLGGLPTISTPYPSGRALPVGFPAGRGATIPGRTHSDQWED